MLWINENTMWTKIVRYADLINIYDREEILYGTTVSKYIVS